ncbi:tRNA(His) guanylyltransferase [Capronia coronata CBS 617.96]|uniref:tRNA(His) guanylyltransferase n=1 Tax=Capronia coronata CBS 617.96 TaxID=1182541 RepID=W9Y6E4_9EURO|nr:tRNA(His) guanylyltransferase [Capronia coronata CBS 617.96]EXJ88103.1 tRNA(His) guanylyltransferase [Capronia coronata CBS 617.96]
MHILGVSTFPDAGIYACHVLYPNPICSDLIEHHSRLSTYYNFTKPNDVRALQLMNLAATHVVKSIPEIVIAYGVSDEYSFVFHRSTNLFERRAAKLVSTVVSSFTAAYVRLWESVFEDGKGDGGKREREREDESRDDGAKGKIHGRRSLDLAMLPTFDGRAVCYPSWENLRDYLSWRQVDCHINNLYNTTFWTLVQQGGMTATAAEEYLKGTVSSDKNEILWSRFGINYNSEPEMFRKGSVVFREYALEPVTSTSSGNDNDEDRHGKEKRGDIATHIHEEDEDDEDEVDDGFASVSKTQAEKIRKTRQKAKVVTRHVDIIKDEFWLRRPWIKSGRPGRLVVEDAKS